MFEIKNISKKFIQHFWESKPPFLDNYSFKIRPGKITGFLGANGAGKTTTIKLLMGFIAPDSGEINFEMKGKNTFRSIGYFPERPYINPSLTGREFLHYMGSLQEMSKAERKSQIEQLSKRFNIPHALDQKVSTYSKGMLQRLGFCSALMHNPELVIFDEPLSGLDPIGRKELKDAIVDLNKEGKTIFFSSHIISDVEQVCDDVVVIEKGKLIFSGPIEELMEQAKTGQYRLVVEGNHELEDAVVLNKTETYTEFLVESAKTNIVLENCLSKKISILEFVPDQRTLEQVIYQIRE